MKPDKSIIINCHQLLQNVLREAFNVPAILFTPPYTDISKIDQGMRAAVWSDYNEKDSKIYFTEVSQEYRILIIKSNLGFYNILIVFGNDTAPDFISIGPFRDDELSPNYFTQILKDSRIEPADIQRMKYTYERMAFAQVDAVVNISKHIIGAFIPEFNELVPELKQYSEQRRTIAINKDLLESNSIKYSEQYQQLLFSFLQILKTGDNVEAKKAMNAFLQEMQLTAVKNTKDYKMTLQVLNDYCHMALLQTTIHPLHIIKQAISTRIKIDNTTSLSKLEQMPNEICHKYCLLVKNYAHPEYSKLTKDVIAYVHLHIEDELTLSSLATHFKKNASVLSNLFSKETGQPLTKFIQEIRVKEAIRLFNTTSMSVADVALAVGYSDFSYFSKVFSKNAGCSPSEYRQLQKKAPGYSGA